MISQKKNAKHKGQTVFISLLRVKLIQVNPKSPIEIIRFIEIPKTGLIQFYLDRILDNSKSYSLYSTSVLNQFKIQCTLQFITEAIWRSSRYPPPKISRGLPIGRFVCKFLSATVRLAGFWESARLDLFQCNITSCFLSHYSISNELSRTNELPSLNFRN